MTILHFKINHQTEKNPAQCFREHKEYLLVFSNISRQSWRKQSHFEIMAINFKWALNAAEQSYPTSLVHLVSHCPKGTYNSHLSTHTSNITFPFLILHPYDYQPSHLFKDFVSLSPLHHQYPTFCIGSFQ